VSSFLRVFMELPEKLGDGRRNLESLHMLSDMGSDMKMVLAGGAVVVCICPRLREFFSTRTQTAPINI
jgi:hypothetical protein